MPISEDEFESRLHTSNPLAYHHYHQQHLQMALSKAEQRKSNKPIMEKKRRARINGCLNELKTLILDAMKKDPARHSKLEKADILEMTVKHLQTIQKQELSVAMAADPNVVHKFKSGFSECATEVTRFIGRLEGIDAGMRQRLVHHLNSCVSGLQQISPFGYASQTAAFATQLLNNNLNLEDLNNNNNRNKTTNELKLQTVDGGIQLIPSRLTTGEFAFVLPNSTSTSVKSEQLSKPLDSPNLISELMNRSHASAFTAVGGAVHPHKLNENDSREDKAGRVPSPSSSCSSPVSFNDSHPSHSQTGTTAPVSGRTLSSNHSDEVTSTSNLDQFKIPQRNFNKHLIKSKIGFQPQVQLTTSRITEGGEGFSSTVQASDEDIPKHHDDKLHAFRTSFINSQRVIKPLMVITGQEGCKTAHVAADASGARNPLDYSIKKVPLNLIHTSESNLQSSNDKLKSNVLHYLESSTSVQTGQTECEDLLQRQKQESDKAVDLNLSPALDVRPRSNQDNGSVLERSTGSNISRYLGRTHEETAHFKGQEGSQSDSDNERYDPPTKRIKLENAVDSDSSSSKPETSFLLALHHSSNNSSNSERDSMWRPW